MADVFISYSRKDREFVRQLHNALANINRDTWIDWEDIPVTAEWLKEIFAGIEAADAFVFVITPDSIRSDICRKELEHALKHNKRIVPVVRREAPREEIPQSLRAINWLYFRECDDFDTRFQELITVLDTDLNWVKAHTRLLVRAIEWKTKNFDSSLLLRGNDLREAYEWLAQAASGKEPKPTELQTEYVLASRKAETKRQRFVLGSVTIGLVIAIILAIIALMQRQVAVDQRQVAQARQLASQSELIRSQSPGALPLSALLALESVSRHPSFEGELALRRGLSVLPRLITYKSLTVPPHNQGISKLAFSPDGRWLAIGDYNGVLRLWDSSIWQERWKVFFSGSGTVPAVRDLAFSPDSRLLASGRDIGTQVWDVASGRQIVDMGDNDQVFSVAFSPNGQWVASGTEGVVRIWEATTGREIYRMSSTDYVSSEIVRFSPDGKLIASSGSDGVIRIWEVATERLLIEKKQVSNEFDSPDIRALAFSPDGRWIASGEGEQQGTGSVPRRPIGGRILVWETTTGKEIARFQHEDAITALDFSADGKWLVSSSHDGRIRVWDVKIGQKIGEFVHGSSINLAEFVSAKPLVVAADATGMARVWDVASNTEVARMTTELPVSINALAQRPNTNQIAIGDSNGGIWVWEMVGHEVAKMEHHNSVFSVAFSPDGKSILTASADKTVGIWNPATGQKLGEFTDDGKVVIALFSPDGRYAASGSLAGIVRVWEVANGHEVMRIQLDNAISSVAFSPDSRWLAAAEGSFPRDGWFLFQTGYQAKGTPAVRVWDIVTGREVARLEQGIVNSIAFSPDGKQLITGGDDSTARVWDVTTGRELVRVYHRQRVNFVNFSPDGRWATSAESCFYTMFDPLPCKPVVKLWDPKTGREFWQSAQPAPWIPALVFSPNSRFLAVANSFVYGCPATNCNNTVQAWDVATGKKISEIVYPDAKPIAVTFSPDSSRIASGGTDSVLRIWDPATAKEITRIETMKEVWSATFSPDMRWIAVGGYSQDERFFVRIYPLQLQDLIDAACSRLTRNFTQDEWKYYIGNEPYHKTCANLPGINEGATSAAKRVSNQQACNVKLVSQIGGAVYATSVQGNYAYLGMGPYLAVLDISNPGNPRLLGRAGPLPDIVRGVAVTRDYAYIANGKGGLHIINVSNPAHPTEVGSLKLLDSANSVLVKENYAYVIDAHSYLHLISIADPAFPYEVSSYALPGTPVDMAIAGNYAYVVDYSYASGGHYGLHIINFADPEIPREAGFYAIPDYAKSVAVSGDYAYISYYHEVSSTEKRAGLQIINISDPARPAEVSSYSTDGSPEDIAVKGDFVYIADGTMGGLRIINVADPAHPNEVSFYGMSSFAQTVVVAENYVYLGTAPASSDSFRSTNGINSLHIIDVAAPNNPRETGVYTTPSFVKDVEVAGDYTYIGTEGGLYVLNVTAPLNPIMTSFYSIPGAIEGMKVVGDYAYIGVNGDLRILKVADPSHPYEVSVYHNSYIQGVAVAGNYAYVAAGDYTPIVDISDKAHPVEIGSYESSGYDVTVAGNYVYLISQLPSALHILEANSAKPTEIGTYIPPAEARGIAVQGRYAYFATAHGLHIVDVSDPARPSGVSSYDTPTSATAVVVLGNYAYIAAGESGLRIINVADPYYPVEVGFYDTSGTAESVAVMGDYVYIADGNGGLVILRAEKLLNTCLVEK